MNGFGLRGLAAAVLLSAAPAWAQGADADKAKQVVDAQCNACHPIGARVGSGYTHDGWKTVMRMMANHGIRVALYGISQINGVIWYSESETIPNTVVRFDPKSETFQSWAIPGGGNIVRNTDVTADGGFVLANGLTNEVTLVSTLK